VSDAEWNSYWSTYSAIYCNSGEQESAHRYYYDYHIQNINRHNQDSSYTYKLSTNQWTGVRYIHYEARFPVTTQPMQTYASPPPSVQNPPANYNPIQDFGLVVTVGNQGISCNWGWAFAAVKAIEIAQTMQSTNYTAISLSAQNIIDCVGDQSPVPQSAFDYLTRYQQDLFTEQDYPNDNTLPKAKMCTPPVSPSDNVTSLTKYSIINDGDDETLMKYVGNGYPVVVEYNIASFEFMCYSSGIFQQPSNLGNASHWLVVIGYGTDSNTGLDYWLCQNSFGTNWGENGYIRIKRDKQRPLAKNCKFPSEFTKKSRCPKK